MSEVKKIATRESYGNALVELAKEHDNVVVLDADLAAATKTGIFKKANPDKFFDCGIAEANMMGIAAGLSTTGKVVTVEEHSVIGGLGSAVCDCLSAKCPTPVTKIGVQDVYGHSGPAVELLKEFGLDGEGVYKSIKEIM